MPSTEASKGLVDRALITRERTTSVAVQPLGALLFVLSSVVVSARKQPLPLFPASARCSSPAGKKLNIKPYVKQQLENFIQSHWRTARRALHPFWQYKDALGIALYPSHCIPHSFNKLIRISASLTYYNDKKSLCDPLCDRSWKALNTCWELCCEASSAFSNCLFLSCRSCPCWVSCSSLSSSNCNCSSKADFSAMRDSVWGMSSSSSCA